MFFHVNSFSVANLTQMSGISLTIHNSIYAVHSKLLFHKFDCYMLFLGIHLENVAALVKL